MAKENKTINVSKKFLNAIPLGIICSVLIVFLFHFFGKWKEIYDTTIPESESGVTVISWTPKVEGFFIDCGIGNANHYVNSKEENYQEIKSTFNSFKIINSFKATFEGHFLAIFLISILTIALIYFLMRFKFKIIN
jgi:hypothetical protein